MRVWSVVAAATDFLACAARVPAISKLPVLPECQPCTLQDTHEKSDTEKGLCAGMTSPGATEWKVYSNKYIYVDVDTSKCKFASTPYYVSAMQGTASHWTSKGSSEIYDPTPAGFRVYINLVITPDEANKRKYAINWIAGSAQRQVAGVCEGQAAEWQAYRNSDMYQDVDTSSCGFQSRPVYVTSLQGKSSHWTSTGSSEVYNAAVGSFRQYIYGSDPARALANDYDYKTNFIAVDPEKSTLGACAGRTTTDDWTKYNKYGIYVDVDTSKCGFKTVPVYVTSLHGTSHHWMSTGSSEIYNPTATGFRIYIASTQDVVSNNRFKAFGWSMEWVAVANVDADSQED